MIDGNSPISVKNIEHFYNIWKPIWTYFCLDKLTLGVFHVDC